MQGLPEWGGRPLQGAQTAGPAPGPCSSSREPGACLTSPSLPPPSWLSASLISLPLQKRGLSDVTRPSKGQQPRVLRN